MKRLVTLIIILLATLLACCAASANTAKIFLRPESQVEPGKPIRISDIATVEGPQALVDKINDIIVSAGPAAGQQRTIEASYIKAKLAGRSLENRVKIDGPKTVVAKGKHTQITSEELSQIARDYVLSVLPQDGNIYDVTIEREPRTITVASLTDFQVKPKMMARNVRPGPNTVQLDIESAGRTVATTSATVFVKSVADVLVATAPIRQGEAITPQNTEWRQQDITRIKGAITMPEDSRDLDWIARRTINPGSIITSNDVTLPPVISKGDTVTLVVTCGNVKLSTTAEARENGRTGDTIRVRPSVSEQDVRAKIIEPGVVAINR